MELLDVGDLGWCIGSVPMEEWDSEGDLVCGFGGGVFWWFSRGDYSPSRGFCLFV